MSATNKQVRIGEHAAGGCPAVDEAVALMGNRWSVLILGVLGRQKSLRYNEVQRAVDGISQRMLTLTLKKLEENGFVKRTVFPSVPPRVDYELTPLGRTLSVPIKALLDWTLENRAAMDEARRAYASASKKARLSST